MVIETLWRGINNIVSPPTPPIGLLDHPSILEQTQWDCGFYKFPNQPRNVEFFNCGIVRHINTTWLVTRKRISNIGRAGHNRISFWRLSNNNPMSEQEVKFYKPYMDEHHEDPRVFSTGNKLFLSYCNFRNFSTCFAHQCIGEVKQNVVVPNPIHPVYGKNGNGVMKNTGHEKNWIWFVHDGEMHFIYMTDPHTVCRLDNNGRVIHAYFNQPIPKIWKHGEMRGGSPPVRIGDEYFCFFHSSLDWKFPKRRYFMGAYAFEAKPPFKITKVTISPILAGSDRDPRNMGSPLTVFPCGSLWEDGFWRVVGGCNDCCCFWTRIPHGELLGKMARI